MNLSKKYPLPEFALLDGDNHLGEQLFERTVILHLPTAALIEVFPVDGLSMPAEDVPQHLKSSFKNLDGQIEEIILVVHDTKDASTVADVLKKAADWYAAYANWIDGALDNI